MRILIRELGVACIAACACVACSSSDSSGSAGSSSSKVIPACNVPDGAATAAEAGAGGCETHTFLQLCQVPSGSTIEADGAVMTPDGAPASCSDACSDTEYELTCTNNASAADSLGCHVLPLPTPEGVSDYCCPCGQ